MLLMLLLTVSYVGCEINSTGKSVNESVYLSENSLSIKENEQAILTATVTPSGTALIWESSDEKVAFVSSSGNVTGVSAGTAIVTATTMSGKAFATCLITVVKAEKESIKLSQSALTLEKNEQAVLTATVTPADTVVNWKSSNESVASVSSSGNVIGLSAGKSTITATTASGKVSATCLVTVEESYSITLSKTELNLFIGDSYQLSALVSPSTGSGKVTWTSSNESAVTVQNGLIKARSSGTALIEAKVGKASAICTVEVKKNPLKAAYDAICARYSSGSHILTLSSDQSYLNADTNPSNLDDYYNATYVNIIESLNKELGLPDYIWQKMLRTRAIDGRQSETCGNIEVSWTYHPDQGIEVLYVFKQSA